MGNALDALHLSPAVKVQTLKLLTQVAQARTTVDLFRASDRAEGFVLGLETVTALNPANVEGLYTVFEAAATARRRENEQ